MFLISERVSCEKVEDIVCVAKKRQGIFPFCIDEIFRCDGKQDCPGKRRLARVRISCQCEY